MKATPADFTQQLKPTFLHSRESPTSVKLATMCLHSSVICTRMASDTNHTTSRTIYNIGHNSVIKDTPFQLKNIGMFDHLSMSVNVSIPSVRKIT